MTQGISTFASAGLLDPVPFQEAIDFVKGKGVIPAAVFRELSPELRARAFTISGLEGAANVMQSVRDRIADLPAGASWNDVKKDLVNEISPYLVDESAEPEERDRQVKAATRRAELLMRIHGYQGYMAAQHEVLDRQRDVFPAWQYKTAGDDRVRDAHAALNDLILPADSPFWDTHYPPWDWGCRCDVIPMMQEDVDAIRQEDKARNPEDRLLVDGARLEELENGDITRGPVKFFDPNDPDRKVVDHVLAGGRHNVASPVEQGKEGAFSWNPKTLKMPVEELAKRYDPKVWESFQNWARNQPAGGAAPTLWQWLNSRQPTKPAAQPKPKPQPSSAKTAAPVPATAIQPTTPAIPTAPLQSKVNQRATAKVTDALSVRAKPELKKRIMGALAAIDKVHRVGDLPPIPVKAHAKGDLGKFVHLKYGGAPYKISIRENGSWPGMSTAHEVGHFLDYSALAGKNKFASPDNPLLDDWRKAVRGSKAFETIKASKMGESRKQYFLSDEEAFARSYAQFIADKSGDSELRKDLDRIRGGVENWRQWKDDDFAPIKKALEKIFNEKGWM